MFDSISNSAKIKINSVSGTLVKNCSKSFFYKCSIDGADAFRLFLPEKQTVEIDHRRVEVVVLQAMVIADGVLLSEVVRKEDFDEMIANEEHTKR